MHSAYMFLKKPGLILLYTVKWFQEFLRNRNISIYYKSFVCVGACGVMVIVIGNGHGDTSSNPRPDWLHFT